MWKPRLTNALLVFTSIEIRQWNFGFTMFVASTISCNMSGVGGNIAMGALKQVTYLTCNICTQCARMYLLRICNISVLFKEHMVKERFLELWGIHYTCLNWHMHFIANRLSWTHRKLDQPYFNRWDHIQTQDKLSLQAAPPVK